MIILENKKNTMLGSMTECLNKNKKAVEIPLFYQTKRNDKMCVKRIPIKIRKPQEMKHSWKIPDYMLKDWENKQYSELLVKCGRCYDCKQERIRNWTYKIFLESMNYNKKCFITLTYKNVRPNKNQLNKKELQNFIKRLRKHIEPEKIKIFTSGEYGETKGRPHYHLIILGYQPKDLKYLGISNRGNKYYDSEEVKKIWGLGRITVQRFSYEEIGYIALYLDTNGKYIDYKNKKAIEARKRALNELKVKLNIMIKTINHDYSIKGDNEKYIYTPVKALKELTKEEYRQYKKEYRKINEEIPLKHKPEFNTWSPGMGFDNWIKKEYYKYDLIIDNINYEIPKEYLRKVLDNIEKYQNNKELIEHVIYHSMERKEYGEQQYRELKRYSEIDKLNEDLSKDRQAKQIWKTEDKEAKDQNTNRIALYKINMSDF